MLLTLFPPGYYDADLFNVQLEEILDENGEKRIVTSFVSGVSISVAAIDQLLDIAVSAPDEFKNNTLGLLGRFYWAIYTVWL